jgi:enamine deaminase RidA (YjgF/YER057c/UK114 family)
MSVEYLNTPGVPEPQGFTHISIARGERIVHVAGQVGQDENGDMVPGGLAGQAERALLNLGSALEAAGVIESDLVKVTVYVVDWDPSKFEELVSGLGAAQAQRPGPAVPVTLVGVQSLFRPDMLVEIEGVAIR